MVKRKWYWNFSCCVVKWYCNDIEIPCHRHIQQKILIVKILLDSFMKKDLQKTEQTEFRTELVINKKGDNCYVKWKGYDNSFISWIGKKRI